MAQQTIIGCDEHLALRISQSASNGMLSHAIILSGQGDLFAAARYTAAAMQCESDHRPCLACSACRKVERGIHPDVTIVEDPEHKNISMDILRDVRADAYILPNEGARKVYIFPDCGKLEPKTQNTLLKVLEEGPPHAAFIFCAENSAVLLQTIRSRAVELKLAPSSSHAEISEDARKLCRLISAGKIADIAAFCTDLENSKVSREDLRALFSEAKDLLAAALAASYGVPSTDPDAARLAGSMSRQRLSAVTDLLQTFIRSCDFNTGVGHLTGALAASLEN